MGNNGRLVEKAIKEPETLQSRVEEGSFVDDIEGVDISM